MGVSWFNMDMAGSKIADFSKKRVKIKGGKKLLTHEGFAYVAIEKDVNGYDFNIKHKILLHFGKKSGKNF